MPAFSAKQGSYRTGAVNHHDEEASDLNSTATRGP